MRLPRQIAYPPCFQRFSSTVPNSSRANLALSSHSLSGSGSRTYGIPSRSTDRRSSIVDHAISRSSTPSARRAPLSGSKRVQYRVVSYHDTRAAMAEDGGTAAAPPPPPGDEEQQKRAPKISLKKPPTREDIPQLQSTVRLVNHEFSARQRECLVRDEGVGPLYEAMMVRVGKKDSHSFGYSKLGCPLACAMFMLQQ